MWSAHFSCFSISFQVCSKNFFRLRLSALSRCPSFLPEQVTCRKIKSYRRTGDSLFSFQFFHYFPRLDSVGVLNSDLSNFMSLSWTLSRYSQLSPDILQLALISVLFFEAQDSPGWTLDKQEGENDAKSQETIYRSSVLPPAIPDHPITLQALWTDQLAIHICRFPQAATPCARLSHARAHMHAAAVVPPPLGPAAFETKVAPNPAGVAAAVWWQIQKHVLVGWRRPRGASELPIHAAVPGATPRGRFTSDSARLSRERLFYIYLKISTIL